MIPILLGLLPGAGRAEEMPSITWLHMTTRSGEVAPDQAPETSADAVLHWLIERLPGYRHTIVLADSARMMALLKSADAVCHPTLAKTEERQAFITFSQRLAWGLPARVIMLDAQAARFQAAGGAVELDRLLGDPGLTGAIENARDLPPAVAEPLSRHRNEGRMVETASAPNMYAMLASGRVDWVIGWPDETQQVLRAEYPDTRVRSFAISGSAALRAGYAGCSKGPQSAKIVADIDRVLRAQHLKDPLQPLYDNWLDPADVAELHQEIATVERKEGE